MNSVGKGVIKKDAMALVTGQPVYCDDLAPKDCLIVKLLRSPHAYAKIKSIDTSIAKRIPGIEAVYTYEDVPTSRFTLAGQSYPEPSPYEDVPSLPVHSPLYDNLFLRLHHTLLTPHPHRQQHFLHC